MGGGSGGDDGGGGGVGGSVQQQQHLVYRLTPDEQVPPLVTQVLEEAGWKEWDPQHQHPDDWNLWWKVGKFRYPEPNQLLQWQRLNHHPKSTCLSKKDHLCRGLRVCREVYGRGIFNFWPLSFNLPSEYNRFANEYDDKCQQEPDKVHYWIVKPAELSRGRGIFMFTDITELQYNCACIVQQYIERPLLISGYKFDLRLYTCVTNFHPLTIYTHNQGLVRFSTDEYDLSSLDNPYAHLTNTSINKHNPDFCAYVQGGTKWTLAQLRHYLLNTLQVDDRWLWQRVAAIIILTFISQLNSIPHARNCFELFGVDILIDENLKPWLLEVNYGPQLICETVTDLKVKKAMIGDLLKLCQFTAVDMVRGHVSSGRQRTWRYNHMNRIMSHPTSTSIVSSQEYGKRYQEQRQLARKKKYLDQWQNIENVYPVTYAMSTVSSAAKSAGTMRGGGGKMPVTSHRGSAGDDEGCVLVSQQDGTHPILPPAASHERPVASARYETHPCFNLPSLSEASSTSVTSPTPLIPPHSGPAGASLQPASVIGGFQMIFPFNEATTLSQSTSDEVRRSVMEVKNLLKSSRQEMNRWPLVSGKWPVDDMLLWKPLIQ